MREKGKLAFWDKEKAFGFIQPDNNAAQIFVHVTSFVYRSRDQIPGMKVSYALIADEQGKVQASKVLFADEKMPSAKPKSKQKLKSKPTGSFGILLVSVYFAYLISSVVNADLPVFLLGWQFVMCLITYIAYKKDKHAAQVSEWRTSENTLHLLALLGGWPAAFFAQQVLRHKSKKQSFKNVFWFTVLLSIASLFWFHTDKGQLFINNTTGLANGLFDEISKLKPAPQIEWSRPAGKN